MTSKDPLLAFEKFEDPPGIEIIDRIERLRYSLHTPTAVSPVPKAASEFYFPVDRGIEITTEQLALPVPKTVCVRDDSGTMLTETDPLSEISFDAGAYILELNTQIQTYIELEGPFTLTSSLMETRIELGEPRTISIGVSSWHERPAAVVTTTTDPADMMAAVSTLGSALKTTSPERSLPSNRGHPPAIELGETLDIPDSVTPPDTGVRIIVPPTYEAIFAVAPLAYYLGAEVVAGQEPRLRTASGFDYSLESPGPLEETIERTLKQIFTLDCVCRTEGVYEVPLHERRTLDSKVDIDWASLYSQPLATQLSTYLEIPYRLVADAIPSWRLTVHVEPVSTSVSHLPFIVDDLALVKTASAPTAARPSTQPEMMSPPEDESIFTRSTSQSVRSPDRSFVEPPTSNSIEQAWIGDHVPIGASKLTMDAFHNRLNREPHDGEVSITIVLNDPEMREEMETVQRVYGDRDDLPFDVDIRCNLSTDELRDCLQTDRSFLHYIGHIEHDGFVCADGKFDASTLRETGIDTFLLNACNSYTQGLQLVEAGAIGGIVTLNEIINESAIQIGETIGRLLHSGFSLRAALTVAREDNIFGGQYIVVGDGGLTVAQAPSRTPNLLRILSVDEGITVELETYATDDAGVGSMYKPHIGDNEDFFLSSGTISKFTVDCDALQTFFNLENIPVRYDDKLEWSSDLDVNTLH